MAAAGACGDCALVVVPRGGTAHFRTWWSLFVAGTRETSRFGGPKSTFRDRRTGSERFASKRRFRVRCSTLNMVVAHRFRDRCSESQLLDMWLVCAQHFVKISRRAKHFVNLRSLEVQIAWQPQHLLDLKVQSSLSLTLTVTLTLILTRVNFGRSLV